MKKIKIEAIKEAEVKPIGTSAHVNVEKKYIGRKAYVLIVTESKLSDDTIIFELEKGITLKKLT